MGDRLFCRPVGDQAQLVPIATPTAAPLRELWMGVHNDIRHTPRIRAVTEFIAAGLKQQTQLLSPV